jgi:hypothetical protein
MTDRRGPHTLQDFVDALRECMGKDPLPQMSPSAALLELAAIATELGDDEVRVLLVLARRLAAGQRTYGRLDVAHDQRDWRRERAEELADVLVYTAIAEVAATIGKDT